MKDTNKNHQNKINSSDELSLERIKNVKPIPHNESGQRLNTGEHTPVLLNAVLKYLNPLKGDSYLDLTAGYGGHASAVLGRTLQYKNTVLVDRDQQAIDYLRQQFDNSNVEIIHKDFLSGARKLLADGKQFDVIL